MPLLNSECALIKISDKIRSEAHRHGWTENSADRNRYNPFARIRSTAHGQGDDLEEQRLSLRYVHTAPAIQRTGNESPLSPVRIGIEKDESISGSMIVSTASSSPPRQTTEIKEDKRVFTPEQ